MKVSLSKGSQRWVFKNAPKSHHAVGNSLIILFLPLGLKSLQSLMSNSTKYNKISILFKFNYTVLIVLSKFIK